MTKVAILGANGQLGSDLVSAFSKTNMTVAALTHEHIEVSEADSVLKALEAVAPDIVINTVAMNNVEGCESETTKAFAINGIGSRNIAKACQKLGAYLIHTSTDYVFDGLKKTPYVETDAPRPLNVYGNSKLSGEAFVLSEAEGSAVVRVSGIYGTHPCRGKAGGLNFVSMMIKLANERDEVRVVGDEILTPTFAEDVAAQMVKMAELRPSGIFHATAQGACSWYDFASRIFAAIGKSEKLHKANLGEFAIKVKRPFYSVLDNAALRAINADIMPSWQDGLDRYLAKIVK